MAGAFLFERYNQLVEKRIETLEALTLEAQNFIHTLSPGKRATLVTLSGELGAGKTTFTQAVAKALGVTEPVTSPTFVLEKIYSLPPEQSFTKLVHIDAYRLKSGQELAALNFDALMASAENLIVLEWPERVVDMLPEPSVALTITLEPDGSRTLRHGQEN